jgi:DNA-binding GntR family transcriptional regulator
LKTSRNNIAYEYLFNKIVTHELEPGSPIVEQEISDTLGISRTPIREALKQLGAEGLVRIIPARGAYVLEISTQDIEEIFSLRQMLEIGALRIGLERMSDDEILEIEGVLSALDENSDNDDFYRSDRILHDMIVSHSGNRRLVNFVDRIHAQIERIRRISAIRPRRLEKSKQEHLAIIGAIKARNLELASALLREHIDNVRKSSLDVINLVVRK